MIHRLYKIVGLFKDQNSSRLCSQNVFYLNGNFINSLSHSSQIAFSDLLGAVRLFTAIISCFVLFPDLLLGYGCSSSDTENQESLFQANNANGYRLV